MVKRVWKLLKTWHSEAEGENYYLCVSVSDQLLLQQTVEVVVVLDCVGCETLLDFQ